MIELAQVVFLFVFGAFIGSYINVVGVRYSTEAGFKSSNTGRSHCPYCGHTLRWYELIPLASFIIQRRRCRECSKKISWQYPIVEIIAGLIFIFPSWIFGFGVPAALWTLIFLIFLLISIIDLRLRVIPNKLNAIVAITGIVLIAFRYISGEYGSGLTIQGTFLGSYAIAFWPFGENILINHAIGATVAIVFFGLLYVFSRGRAMGFGDVKLASAVGILMGWPDVALALILSFILGSVVGVFYLLTNKKGMKDTLPFGPFIVLGVTLVFLFGYDIINGYFRLFNIY